jgi:hypothetical protein
MKPEKLNFTWKLSYIYKGKLVKIMAPDSLMGQIEMIVEKLFLYGPRILRWATKFWEEAYGTMQEAYRTMQKAYHTMQEPYRTVQKAHRTMQSVQENLYANPAPKSVRTVQIMTWPLFSGQLSHNFTLIMKDVIRCGRRT